MTQYTTIANITYIYYIQNCAQAIHNYTNYREELFIGMFYSIANGQELFISMFLFDR